MRRSNRKASNTGCGAFRRSERSWPELWKLRLDEITAQACKEWAAKLSKEIACHYYNNTIATLRQVLQVGIKAHKETGGGLLENPATELKRVRVKQKDLQLPEPSQFKELVKTCASAAVVGGGASADLVEFLAYSGMRIRSEALWVTWEDIDWQRKEIIVRGHPDTGTKNSEIRRIPIIPDMEAVADPAEGQPGDRSPRAASCKFACATKRWHEACKEIGISRLTHHDLRHLFATRCIESGVDIPTVSRWLGHKDGGALAMKTYGHLRNEHSQAMAQKVKF